MSAYRILYGDIHTTTRTGYGVGSIERSLDVARTHLDFFAFTGHSSWHDMPTMEGDRAGTMDARLRAPRRQTWPRVQQVIADGNRDGAFCSFLGFEWHSSHWGDQCVGLPARSSPAFCRPDNRQRRSLLRRGKRTDDPAPSSPIRAAGAASTGKRSTRPARRCRRSISEHGNGEHDRGRIVLQHFMGGRETAHRAGPRIGDCASAFVGSSDDHAGFRRYGEGLMAALVERFSRADSSRRSTRARTYRADGDRIELGLARRRRPMGAGDRGRPRRRGRVRGARAR
jgi:hypothetical protein